MLGACSGSAGQPGSLGSGGASATGGRVGGSGDDAGVASGGTNGGGTASPDGSAGTQGTGTGGGGTGGRAPSGSGGGGGASATGGSPATGGRGGVSGGTGGAVGPNPTAATRMLCTGTNPIACHFGGAPGNYDVTVVLGGAAAAATTVGAEANRVMLPTVATAAGQSRRLSFSVNVRQPEGEPIQAVSPGTPGLDVYFFGANGLAPALQSIGYAAAPAPFMIYLAGDSTVCDQTDTNYGGWGQIFPRYFDFPVVVANYADSGESSGSFLASANLFGAITSRLKPNDWVLIQFGHNDKTNTGLNFHDNMTALVAGVKAKGAFPVLITPEARAQFDATTNQVSPQHINSTGADLPAIVKQVGTEQQVPVLDLTARTVTWLNQLGPNGWQIYHALGTDVTHTTPPGAAVVAGFVRDLIVQANLSALTGHLRAQ